MDNQLPHNLTQGIRVKGSIPFFGFFFFVDLGFQSQMNFRLQFSFYLLFQIAFAVFSFGQTGKMQVTNSSGVSLQMEPITLNRKALEAFVEIPKAKNKTLLVRVNGNDLPSQLDDLDGDGEWDELAFQLDMERNSTLEIKFKWVEISEAPQYERRTLAFLGVSDRQDGKFEDRSFEICPESWQAREQPPRYHMEGPVWENDKVGFRYFFDPRNRPEIMGKTTSRLVLDSLGRANTNLNRIQTWGMRVFNSESGLGVGGLALIEKGEPFPIRKSDPVQFIRLANGPCRAVFDLIHENWNVNGNRYQLRQRISIWSGKYWYKNEILFSGFIGPRTLAIGIGGPKMEVQPIYKTLTKNWSGFFTHGMQSENSDGLGLGFLLATRNFDGYGETPRFDPIPKSDDSLSHSHFAQLKVKSGIPIEVYVFGAWEKTDVKFGNTRYFIDLLQEEADKKEVDLKFSEK